MVFILMKKFYNFILRECDFNIRIFIFLEFSLRVQDYK